MNIQNVCKWMIVGWVAMMLLISCIRDEMEACPPLQVKLQVTDKNYLNVRSANRLGLEEILSDNLPFGKYVSNLTYRVIHVESGKEVLNCPLSVVEGNESELLLPLPTDLPYGHYVLTAWGNLTETTKPDDDWKGIELHRLAKQGADVYYTVDTLEYGYGKEQYTCGMKRLKGKLIVEVKNLPDSYSYSYKAISDIHSRWEIASGYLNPIDMNFETYLSRPNYKVTKTHLAPSVAEAASVVDIHFTQQPEAVDKGEWLAAEPVSITMRRNELTVLRYDYDRCCCCFNVYILINDNWETLHSMEIN